MMIATNMFEGVVDLGWQQDLARTKVPDSKNYYNMDDAATTNAIETNCKQHSRFDNKAAHYYQNSMANNHR